MNPDIFTIMTSAQIAFALVSIALVLVIVAYHQTTKSDKNKKK